MEIVIASHNRGKIREYQELFQAAGINGLELLCLADFPGVGEPKESGATFKANAQLKADFALRATGKLSLADDSGLEVDYLGGAPGVHSARFAGEPKDDARNNQKLLALLRGVPKPRRRARFRCVICIALPWGEKRWFEGCCEGYIGFSPRGHHGFGYDPLFVVPRYRATMAELPPVVKNRISHRARAFRSAAGYLRKVISPT